ncbi:MAG: transcriptional modulator of MazE/toxin, MazF [Caulobacteraceae bacterium]|nr:transcriptional modulator of MazE/toxin, MazF [Caulobacteraceae bacterium]
MRRGDVVTVALSGDYGKPRPALVVQADVFDAIPSVTVLPLTSQLTDAALVRITIPPASANGLRVVSQVMIDKAITVPRGRIGDVIGRLDGEALRTVGAALSRFLDLG